MESDYLIDTNIVIYLLDKKLPETAEAFLIPIIDQSCQLSVITQIELLSWLPLRHEDKLILEIFVDGCHIIDLSAAIVKETIRLRQRFKIKLPDVVIAATARINGWTLVSRNDKDFGKITGLKYINPFTDLYLSA